MLTIPNVATLTGLSRHMVEQYIASGFLPTITIPTSDKTEKRVALAALRIFSNQHSIPILLHFKESSQ